MNILEALNKKDGFTVDYQPIVHIIIQNILLGLSYP